MTVYNELEIAKAALVRMAEHSARVSLAALPPSRIYAPAPESCIEVEALTGNWLHEGKPVTPGARYTVLGSTAQALEFTGKARRL